MTPADVIQVMEKALWMAIMLGAPPLGATLLVGVAISTVQAATQINEMTLSFLPKLAAVAIVFWMLADWMLQHWLGYVGELWSSIATMG